jgi:hypothetical protein
MFQYLRHTYVIKYLKLYFSRTTRFMFEQFATVFEKHKDNTECVLWVLELIGQIQAVTAEKAEESEILFLCNTFILATIVFSGHSVFLQDFPDCDEMCKYFPRAVATLLDINHWSICTTQVCYRHFNSTKKKTDKSNFRRWNGFVT